MRHNRWSVVRAYIPIAGDCGKHVRLINRLAGAPNRCQSNPDPSPCLREHSHHSKSLLELFGSKFMLSSRYTRFQAIHAANSHDLTKKCLVGSELVLRYSFGSWSCSHLRSATSSAATASTPNAVVFGHRQR